MSGNRQEAALDAARAYCATINSRDAQALDDFLASVHRDLAALYASVIGLPVIEPSDTTQEWAAWSHEAWSELYTALKLKLGRLDLYREIYHPYGDETEAPVIGSLADAMADVYGATWMASRIADAGAMDDAAFALQLEFEIHAGHHVLDALRAIHMHRFAPTK